MSYTARAIDGSGRRFNPDYLSVKEDDDRKYLEITFSNKFSYGVDHAVYIVGSNIINTELVTNWYCFMITSCPTTERAKIGENGAVIASCIVNLCENYCKIERSDPFAGNEI